MYKIIYNIQKWEHTLLGFVPLKSVCRSVMCKNILGDNYLQCKLCARSLHYKCVGVNSKNKTVCSHWKVDDLYFL